MITIQIEEAEAYDRLSILIIKNNFKGGLDANLLSQINNLEEQINLSISRDLAIKIFNSQEFKDLKEINEKLFVLFNECKMGGMDALIPDKENIARHHAKNNLQKKFFGKKTEEVKIGY